MSSRATILPKGKEPTKPEPTKLTLEFPPYWPKQGWKKLWGGSGGDDAPDEAQLLKLFNAGNVSAKEYDSAILPMDCAFGRAITAYMERNIVLKTYKAPKREATRMLWSKNIAANKDNAYSSAWVASATERLKEGKKGGPKPPSSGAIEIKKIKILRNVTLWAGYSAMREQIRGDINAGEALRKVRFVNTDPKSLPVLDAEIGEVLLFHGTSKATMQKIAVTGFDPNFCVNKGTPEKPNYGAVGRGVYFSDSFSKVMTYTVCYHCGAFKCGCSHTHGGRTALSKRVTFLARVVLGAPKNKRALGQHGTDNIRKADLDSLPDDRHSVYAKGYKLGDFKFVSGSNEFVVKELHQMYPEFVIYWTHA